MTTSTPVGSAPPSGATFSVFAARELVESKTNPRKTFGDLGALAASIQEHGVIEPLVVRQRTTGEPFEIVCGARRFRAAAMVHLDVLPCLVRELSDAEALELQLVENGQREDVHPMEEAEGYARLRDAYHYDVARIAQKVKKGRAHVAGRLKLLELGTKGREAYAAGRLTLEVALLLARVPGGTLQDQALSRVAPEWLEQPMPTKRALEILAGEFMRRLELAPFDRASSTLLPAAGACAVCPKRTGNQRELFGDVESRDVCTDPTCYAKKVEADWQLSQASAEKKGQRVLEGKDAAKIAPQGFLSADYVDLDEVCADDGKGRTWRALLGKKAPPASLLRDKEGKREVVRRTEALAALKDAGHTFVKRALREQLREKATPSGAAVSSPDVAAAQEKARLEREVGRRKMEAIVEGAAKGAGKAFWLLLARCAIGVSWSETVGAVVARRGIEKKKGGKTATASIDVAYEAAKAMGESELRGLVVELLVTRFAAGGENAGGAAAAKRLFDDFAEHFGVDAKKVVAEARSASKSPVEKKLAPKSPSKAAKKVAKKKARAR